MTTCPWPTEGESFRWTCHIYEPNTTVLEAVTQAVADEFEEEPMGYPYRQRHAEIASTTSDKLAGTQAKQQTAKSASVAKKGKRSSK